VKGYGILASIQETCDKCNSEVKFYFTQRIDSYNGLSWSGSFKCAKCNNSIEVDGIGELDDFLRDSIIEQEGLWGLQFGIVLDKVNAVRIIRKALNLTIEEVKKIKNRIPGIAIKGTNVEMQRLQLLLRIEGIISEVVRIN